MIDLTPQVRHRLLASGATQVGFADMGGVLEGGLARWPRAISIALAFPEEVIGPIAEGPTAEYLRAYERFNERLNEIAAETVQFIRTLGYEAEFVAATLENGILDDQSIGLGFQHKTAATRAGLGWVGKSALLITYERGPRVRLVTVFTDAPLEVGRPVTASECGRCVACVRACPGDAITGEDWWAGRPREEFFDAGACLAEARRQLMERVGVDKPVCGICIASCPKGRPRSERGRSPSSGG